MFIVVMRDIADVEPFEHQPGAANLARGSAAVLTAGSLAKCGATAMSRITTINMVTYFRRYQGDPEHRCSERDCHRH